MTKWYKLGDHVRTSLKGITPKYVDQSDVIVLNQKCIRNNKIDFSLARFHNQDKTFNDSKILQIGDLLFNSTGQGTAGRCAFVKELPKDKVVITDSHILIIRIKDHYLAECFSYACYNKEVLIQTFMDGSTGQGELDKLRLFNIEFKFPEKTGRKLICDFLNDIDAKIELNNKIIAELQAMAKTLYGFWFLQFDFPDKNGRPYKSSGGKMLYNEQLKREIPEGWEVKTLQSIASVSKTTLNPMDEPLKEFRYYSLPEFDASRTYAMVKGNQIKSNKFTVKNQDILVSKLNPWFSRVIYPMNEQNMICSTEFVVWEPELPVYKNFLYQLAIYDHFIAYCTQSATGTSNSHKRINPDLMMDYKTPYNKNIIIKYSEIIEPWLKKIALNRKEKKELTELRDWLLPMLMNGQVSVGEVEEELVERL